MRGRRSDAARQPEPCEQSPSASSPCASLGTMLLMPELWDLRGSCGILLGDALRAALRCFALNRPRRFRRSGRCRYRNVRKHSRSFANPALGDRSVIRAQLAPDEIELLGVTGERG